MSPTEPNGEISRLSAILKLAERYGLSTVLVLVLMTFFLTTLRAELKATRETLEKHVTTTMYGNYLQYVACTQLATLAGTPQQACTIPKELTGDAK